MRLVAHALLQTLELRAVEIVCQDGIVIRVRAFLDNDTGALAGRETSDIGETLDTALIKSE